MGPDPGGEVESKGERGWGGGKGGRVSGRGMRGGRRERESDK
jgi:hypothetical protein